MEINDIRILTTVVSLLLFLALVAHAWSRRSRGAQQEASMLIFEPEMDAVGPLRSGRANTAMTPDNGGAR